MRVSRAVWAILAAALVLRLAVAWMWAPTPAADAADYERLAVGILEGNGYVTTEGEPTSWRPPLYPAFLASVYAATGESRAAARTAQALLGTATVGMTMVIAGTVAGPGVALFAGALAALDPAGAFAVSRLLSEVLFTFLLVSSVLFLQRAVGEENHRRTLLAAAAAGAALGLATLTRSVLIFYPLLAAAAWLSARQRSGGPLGFRRSVAVPLALLAGFALVLAPWSVRNWKVHGEFVPVATQGGITLYAGNHPVDGWILGLLPDDDHTREAATLSEVAASEYLARTTLVALAADPGRIPFLAALKTAYFWVPLDWEILPRGGLPDPVYAFMLLWACVGAWMVVRTPALRGGVLAAWPLWLPVAYSFAMALVVYGSPRFRMPLHPLLAVAAAAALARVAATHGRRSAVRWAGATAGALLVAALAAEPAKALLKGALGL